jgi:hypothetical protein
VLLPTSRGFTRKAFECNLYEAQDVLADVADVDMVRLEPRAGFQFKSAWHRRLLYRDVTRRLVFLNPGLKSVTLTRDYDIFISIGHLYRDQLYINAIDRWRERCRVSVCWIGELYASFIPRARYWLHALKKFDHVFLGTQGGVDALSDAIGRQVRWLPGVTDVMRFSPYPAAPARVIDVYSMGRRWEGIHQSLLREASRSGLFYLHDTAPVSETDVFDHRQHRNVLANIAKRSTYFMVAPGKMDHPEETGGQSEVSFRYFEGAAAGAVLLGQTPQSPTFQEVFGWPDAVIDIKPDGSDVIKVISDMNRQPERIRAISRRNATQALLRHDWIHFWKQIFDVAGLQIGSGAAARIQRLSELACFAND